MGLAVLIRRILTHSNGRPSLVHSAPSPLLNPGNRAADMIRSEFEDDMVEVAWSTIG